MRVADTPQQAIKKHLDADELMEKEELKDNEF